MNNSIQIDGTKIGLDFPPYVIAEMSANHNGDINNAFKIIEMSKAAGANAVKLQTYHPDLITLNINSPDFMIEGGLWGGQTLHKLYRDAYMPWEWHKTLFDYAKKIGITIFSSPFDNTAVDLLEDLNTPAYKIASFEAIDIPLIEYVAKTGKPMIISTGMANENEIHEAINAAKENGCKELAILHCVSSYPAPASEYNLKTLSDMHNKFNLVTGLSDHTIDNTTSIASIGLGSSIVEKHVTLNREGGGADDSFSLEFDQLSDLCINLKIAWDSMGKVDYGQKSSEKSNIKFRRSLYFIQDIASGETIKEKHIRSIRPGFGLKPKYLSNLLGRKVNKNISLGTAVKWEDID